MTYLRVSTSALIQRRWLVLVATRKVRLLVATAPRFRHVGSVSCRRTSMWTASSIIIMIAPRSMMVNHVFFDGSIIWMICPVNACRTRKQTRFQVRGLNSRTNTASPAF